MRIVAVNQIIVFGGGTALDGQGVVQLHPASLQRADRVIAHYIDNKEIFSLSSTSHRPFILCTGGFGLLSAGVTNLKANEREAVLMADYLATKGGIPQELILLEKESISTLTNWTNSMRFYPEELEVDNFSRDQRLGLVSHPHHLERVVFLAEKLGYQREHLELIPTSQTDNKDYESQLLAVYMQFLGNAKGPQEMIEQESKLAQDKELVARLRGLQ